MLDSPHNASQCGDPVWAPISVPLTPVMLLVQEGIQKAPAA